jgi:fused signal recognition particle receptor
MFEFLKKQPSPPTEPVAATTASTAPRAGLFARLKNRLATGGSKLTQDLASLWPGRKIDAELLDDLETRLLTADVGIPATEQILHSLRQRVARRELNDLDALLAALRAAITDLLKPVARPLTIDRSHQPHVILVVGVNGSGKTTSIGKLTHYLQGQGHSVVLAAGDTFRAAAVEQLEVWGQRNNVPVIAQASGADPAAVIFDAFSACRARAINVLVADTAGRLQTQSHLMDELKKIKRVLMRQDANAPHEVLLVLDGSQGQNALSQARLFHEALGVTGLILTKLDGTAKGGILIAIAKELALPIRFVGTGEGISDFGEFDVHDFVTHLVSAPHEATDG